MADYSSNNMRRMRRMSSYDPFAPRKRAKNIREVFDESKSGDSSHFARMAATRRNNDRLRAQGALGTGLSATGPDLTMASGRPRDPMFYWRQNNLPFDFTKPEQLRKVREFCNTPDAPILMADGTYKTIGTVQPGDMVLGWKNEMTRSGGLVRHWQPSKVLATNTRQADVVQITMRSGAVIKCTPDHKWANPYFTKNLDYTNINSQSTMTELTSEYRPATVNEPLLAVAGTYVVDVPELIGWELEGLPAATEAPTSMDYVETIEPIGLGDVVSMQTETGNYVAWNFASKNCRLLYMTHPVVAACVDIYSKLPLQGMHIECKDEQLVEFYTDLFMDQLKLEDHLVKLGRQYWLSGEIFTLGMWNESLGVWEDEQIISPDDVEIEKSLFIRKPRFLMKLPDQLRKVLTERAPVWEYEDLIKEYPELIEFAKEDDLMPVSNYIMYQLKFEADDFSDRGISILMRAFRTLIQEEMLMTALDSIADRLYTPMIVAKLGASAEDLGTEQPWIPDDNDKEQFNQSLDEALAGDFRVLTTNFATNIETVFGRENVPDLTNDFDRITERILMAFGLSQTMLTGASAGETYAADALNRDVVTQLLTHYQRKLQQYFHDRASIVAEAQEHFDYEVRNGERYLVTEDIWEVDEETGEETLYEQPKLLVPELKFKILNLSDESEMSEFIESLAVDGGVPIPMRERIKRTGIDFNEMIEMKTQETIQLAVAEQRTRKELYSTLVAEGLPIPDDLIKDFRPQAIAGPLGGGSDVPVPTLGQGPQSLPVLAPTEDDLEDDQMAEGQQDEDDAVNEQTDPENEDSDLPQEGDDVPPESSEQMDRMPKASSQTYFNTGNNSFQIYSSLRRRYTARELRELLTLDDEVEPVEVKHAVRQDGKPVIRTKAIKKLGIRQVARARFQQPDNERESDIRHYQPHGRFGMPKVVGMRKYLSIPDELKLRTYEE